MNKFILNCFGILLSVPSFTQDRTYDLMPLAQHMKSTADRFRITKRFNMGVTGSPGDRVYKEATRCLRRLDNRVGLFFRQENITSKDNNTAAGLLMRRLVNGNDTKALEILIDVIEPLKIDQRNAGDTMYTVFSPYAKIADVGLQSMGYLKNHARPPFGWRAECMNITEKAKEQGGRCELQVVTAIEELVNAASK